MTAVLERRIRVADGLRLRVEERSREAEGHPLLLLHGFTGSVEAWGEGVLRALAATRRVLAVDLPGHGGSDVPSRPDRYAVERVVGDLGAVLDDAGVERAVWVGYSMGGRVALAGAVLRPERVAALVLEGASPGLDDADARRERRRADEALARRIEDEGLVAFVDDWMALPLFSSQRRLPDDVLSEARSRRLRCDPGGLAGALRGLGTGSQPSFWDRLDEVAAPTLLVTGSLDAKYEALAQRMAEALPRAVRESVADAGHTVHLERPAEWLRAVGAFLARLEDAA